MKDCAQFEVVLEPDHATSITNRVERIAYLRDYQRELLRVKYEDIQENDAIIIADLDLFALPNVNQLVRETNHMIKNKQHDALCSAGVMYRPFGYYDIFATVLFSDTFTYPIKGRLSGKHYPEEDTSFVRTKDVFGVFTQSDLLEYFETGRHPSTKSVPTTTFVERSVQREGNDSIHDNVAVPVRSCFGGLTIYSAPKWFDTRCNYNMNITSMMRYANKNDGRPCEHVVFHNCLITQDPSTSIAVHPFMKSKWNSPDQFDNRLVPGPVDHSLVTHARRRDAGDQLVNGNHTLRINEHETLVLEVWNDTKSEVLWSAKPTIGQEIDTWTHMVLMLKKNGKLLLIKTVPNIFYPFLESTNRKGIHPKRRNETGYFLCDEQREICPLSVWSSAIEGPVGDAFSYALVLGDDGKLKIIDENSDNVLWTNEGTYEEDNAMERVAW
eukprot:CAMPEP_0195521706 /NCGR_PEP_ID=MMETSP0794_2-20130614/19203_1 /TAXON_ID=515487 /ORGANISM="Stephanopyxis turris, Strain CCMP 815" /LENGTH=439 /DNA_ID=CAMNT_0040651315 /DNA_START=499 /DNA_END=1818 /DNA_ORIENTATION=+